MTQIPDGKPENKFSHNGEFLSREKAIEVIEETYRQWLDLMLGAANKGELDLTSVTHKHLVAQGLSSNAELGHLPEIEYPKLDHWRVNAAIKGPGDVDRMRYEYELQDESPDQLKKTDNSQNKSK